LGKQAYGGNCSGLRTWVIDVRKLRIQSVQACIVYKQGDLNLLALWSCARCGAIHGPLTFLKGEIRNVRHTLVGFHVVQLRYTPEMLPLNPRTRPLVNCLPSPASLCAQ
jgi:hypothetical protein